MKKYFLFKNDCGYYIAQKINYQSGDLAFFHQVSKYYYYKKNALKYVKMIEKLI